MRKPRKGQGKLALMRRADSEPDQRHEREGPAPITLPRLKFMEKPLDDEPKGPQSR